jgi:hypothetical protein
MPGPLLVKSEVAGPDRQFGLRTSSPIRWAAIVRISLACRNLHRPNTPKTLGRYDWRRKKCSALISKPKIVRDKSSMDYFRSDTKRESVRVFRKESRMARSWFRFPGQEDEMTQNGMSGTTGELQGPAVPDVAEQARPAPRSVPTASERGTYLTFDQIYQGSGVKPPKIAYGILKVASMVNSGHLAGMSPEAKRNSLLMALEAAGVEIEDLLQDAVVRQKALNDYEDAQQQKLKELESAKLEENNRTQIELDRITGQHVSRIQANLDDIAHEQDRFRTWQRAKQQEAQRITEAAAFCVPQGNSASGLTEVLERATLVRR